MVNAAELERSMRLNIYGRPEHIAAAKSAIQDLCRRVFKTVTVNHRIIKELCAADVRLCRFMRLMIAFMKQFLKCLIFPERSFDQLSQTVQLYIRIRIMVGSD